jgi:hypothetical protein
MNEAINYIMAMVENGTDLYTAFQTYFASQKDLFESTASQTQADLTEFAGDIKREGDAIIDTIETTYRNNIDTFERNQEAAFDQWFNQLREQLSGDVAGNLQNQIDTVEKKVDGRVACNTAFSADGKTVTETRDNQRVVTEFVSDSVIRQKFYDGNTLVHTKTITFSADGMSVSEVVG